MRIRSWIGAVVISAAATCSFAQVTGSIKLDGKAPEAPAIDMSAVKECQDCHPDPVPNESIIAKDGNLKNVIVSIKVDDGSTLGGTAKTEPAVIDQKGCMYVPHVTAIQTNQPITIKSDDGFMHNVQSLATTNAPFNLAFPGKDPGKNIDPQKAVETFNLKCQVHPWMACWVRVIDHPFFATSGDDGKFSIDTKGLADGEYTFVAWHERLGEQEAKGTVKGGKAEVNFTFKPE